MRRRDLLRGLLALPLAPLAAKLLPRAPVPFKQLARVANIDTTDIVAGSDHTSIYIADWGESGAHWIYPEPLPRDSVPREIRRNWLKESLRA